ncbi:MAG: cation:proton antiporter [Nitrospinae bacterium]|nr:cation:proton antiporter [Nitrospinota bacterium]
MEVSTFFIHITIILFFARLLGEMAAYLSIPPVIGELMAGIILGPSLLSLIEPSDVIKLLAEIGIILLLFEVGLETDIMRLMKTGFNSTVVALFGVTAPFVFGFCVSYYLFALPFLTSLFAGGTLTATSIGITVRILTDMARHHSREAQMVLGAAVIDDIIGVILLAFLYDLSLGKGVSLQHTSQIFIFVVLFMALAPMAAKFMAGVIRRFDNISQIPGLIPTTLVSLVLFFAWLAHAVGAPELLGGFAAGIALSRRFFLPMGLAVHAEPSFAHRIEENMKPIVHLFTPIFFVMVGLSLNLKAVNWGSSFVWIFSAALLITAIMGKIMGAFFIKEDYYRKWAIGLCMIPRGEVGLIFAELGKSAKIFNEDIYATLIIVIAMSTVLPIFAIKWFYTRFDRKLDSSHESSGAE